METPIDKVAKAAATMTPTEFLGWFSQNLQQLKENEINNVADAYYEGMNSIIERFETVDKLAECEAYCVKKYEQLPTFEK
jgi:hypothetical protein